jgi:hypothetical protein
MFKNASCFASPNTEQTFLRARGFDDRGERSGGLCNPRVVNLSSGTTLYRLYQDPKRKLGEWWFTPQEMQLVAEYFARSGPAFADGRKQGKGILHAVLAVRHNWGDHKPGHLGRFWVVQLREHLMAYFGEADDAPGSGQAAMQKAGRIAGSDGFQRRVRQIFLPKAWEYAESFSGLSEHLTDATLLRAIHEHRGSALYFE